MNIAVIGGGAAGMMAAIKAAECGAKVTVYERNDRVGKKILATGNGKCNFTNTDMKPLCFHGKDVDAAWKIIKQFDEQAVIDFFEKAGMLTKVKNGCLYPASGQASTVLDILRMQLINKGITVLTEQFVKEVKKDENSNRILVITKSGKNLYDSVIIACGGAAAPKTGSDGNGVLLAKKLGHTIIATVPALVQLRSNQAYFKSISGVRTDAALTLILDDKAVGSETGEIQFTDYGISGIVVFQLSRMAAYGLLKRQKTEMYINCLPEFTDKAYAEFVKARKEALKNADTIESFFTGMLNKKLMILFIKLAGLKPTDNYKGAEKSKIDKVFSLCRHWVVPIDATNSFENAQVTAGGVPLKELTEDLESKIVKNIYFSGECIDVDGACGGYNLQWAWSSGCVAGKAVCKK